MLNLTYTSKFKKDMRRAKKCGYNIQLINIVLEKLQNEETLKEIYKDHELKGSYSDFRECHIQPDWLLICIIKKR